MKWFRIHHSLFDDNTYFKRFSDAERYRYIHLYFLASKSKERNGKIRLDDESIAYELRCNEEDWLIFKAKLKAKGFIDIFSEGISICSWASDQYVSDTSTERVKKHREAKKRREEMTLLTERNTCETFHTVTETELKQRVTPSDTDTDTYSDPDSETETYSDPNSETNSKSACEDFFDFPDELVDPLVRETMPVRTARSPVPTEFSSMQFDEFWQFTVPREAKSDKGLAKQKFMHIEGVDYKTFRGAYQKAIEAYLKKHPNEQSGEKFRYFKSLANWISAEGWLDFVPEHMQSGSMNLEVLVKSLPSTFNRAAYVILPDGDWRLNTAHLSDAEFAQFSRGSYSSDSYRKIHDINGFMQENPDAIRLEHRPDILAIKVVKRTGVFA
jgi:hypothetical protein